MLVSFCFQYILRILLNETSSILSLRQTVPNFRFSFSQWLLNPVLYAMPFAVLMQPDNAVVWTRDGQRKLILSYQTLSDAVRWNKIPANHHSGNNCRTFSFVIAKNKSALLRQSTLSWISVTGIRCETDDCRGKQRPGKWNWRSDSLRLIREKTRWLFSRLSFLLRWRKPAFGAGFCWLFFNE